MAAPLGCQSDTFGSKTPESPADASALEGGGIVDGSVSDGRALSDATPNSCDGGSTFCDDFERSGTRSLSAAIGTSEHSDAYLYKQFEPTRSVALAYWIYVDGTFADRQANVSPLLFRLDDRTVEIFALANGVSNQMEFAEQEIREGNPATYRPIVTAPLIRDRWVSIELRTDRTSSPHTVFAAYDGQVLANGVALRHSIPVTNLELHAGIVYASRGPQTTLWVDDVSLRLTP